MKYASDFMQKGGKWLGSLRNRVQTMFICGNGETITWGSNEEVKPHPTMKQLEELGSYAVEGYHNEVVGPMIEAMIVARHVLRVNSDQAPQDQRKDIEATINLLSMQIDKKPEWIVQADSKQE